MLALDRWALARTRACRRRSPRPIGSTSSISSTRRFTTSASWIWAAFTWMSSRTGLHHASRQRGAPLGQTAMYHIAESMVRWLAPILSFTAEEIWRFLPGEHEADSVFLATWHTLPPSRRSCDRLGALMKLRAEVTRELEKLRDAGAIGAPLDARGGGLLHAAGVRALCGPGARAALPADHLARPRARGGERA